MAEKENEPPFLRIASGRLCAVSPVKNAFVDASIDGLRIVACASFGEVLFYCLESGDFDLIGSIVASVDNDVSCLAFQPNGNKLAVCCLNMITIYSLSISTDCSESSSKIVSKNILQFTENSSVSAISWLSQFDLVVSGSGLFVLTIPQLCLHEKSSHSALITQIDIHEQQNEVYRYYISETSTPEFISPSPCGRFLAALDSTKSLIKIWFHYEGSCDFYYLSHPAPVKKLAWRPLKKSGGSYQPSVIATTCTDGFVRLWTETSFEEKIKFFMTQKVKHTPYSSIAWGTSPTVAVRVFKRNKRECPLLPQKHDQNRGDSHEQVADSPAETILVPDILLVITEEGSLHVYAITMSQRIPRWKTKCEYVYNQNCIRNHGCLPEQLNCIIHVDTAFPVSKVTEPSKLVNSFGQFLVNSVSCTHLDNRGVLSQRYIPVTVDSPEPGKMRQSSIYGHSKTIKLLKSHPRLPYVVSYSDGLMIIWEEYLSKDIDPKLKVRSVMTVDGVLFLEWNVNDPVLLIARQGQIGFYEIESSSILRDKKCDSDTYFYSLGTCPSNPLALHCQLIRKTQEICIYLVFVISVDGQVHVKIWSRSDSGVQYQEMPCANKLTFDFRITSASHAPFDSSDDIYFWFSDEKADVFLVRYSVEDGYFPDKIHAKLVFRFNTELGHIINVKPDRAFSNLAVCSKSEKGFGVHIYSQDANIEIISPEYDISIRESNEPGIEWIDNGTGSSHLAIQKHSNIEVYSKRLRSDENPGDTEWILSAIWNISSSNICWSLKGSLIASQGRNIFTTSTWICPEKNLVHELAKETLPLPEYHPKRLSELLLFGNNQLVEMHLRNLYDFLHKDKDENDFGFWGSSQNVGLVPPLPTTCYLNAPSNEFRMSSEMLEDLSSRIVVKPIPAISHTEQLQLLGIIGTFKEFVSKQNAFDKAALKFMYAKLTSDFSRFHHHHRSSAGHTRQEQTVDLNPADFIWAFHSMNQEDILKACLPEKLSWASLRSLGVPLWLRSSTELKMLVERLAKDQFSTKRNAHDCFLTYMILKKKSTAQALFKSTGEQKLGDFLKNDFNETRWKTAASKNAFVLLSQHKYDMAVSFFVLGGFLTEAFKVCFKQLKDPLLAVLIARVYEGENGENFPRICQQLLEEANAKADFWMESICYWWLHQYEDAAHVLASQLNQPSSDCSPHISILYEILSSKPQLKLLMTHKIDTFIDKLRLWSKTTLLRKSLGDPILSLEDLLKASDYADIYAGHLESVVDMEIYFGRLENLRTELIVGEVIKRCASQSSWSEDALNYVNHLCVKYKGSVECVLRHLHRYHNMTVDIPNCITFSGHAPEQLIKWTEYLLDISMIPFTLPSYRTQMKRNYDILRSLHEYAVSWLTIKSGSLSHQESFQLYVTPMLVLYSMSSAANKDDIQCLICRDLLHKLLESFNPELSLASELSINIYQRIYALTYKSILALSTDIAEPVITDNGIPITDHQLRFLPFVSMEFVLLNVYDKQRQLNLHQPESIFSYKECIRRVDVLIGRILCEQLQVTLPKMNRNENAIIIWEHIAQNAVINNTMEKIMRFHDSVNLDAHEYIFSEKVEIGQFSNSTKGIIVNKGNPSQIALAFHKGFYQYNTNNLPVNMHVDMDSSRPLESSPMTSRHKATSIGQNLNIVLETMFGSEKPRLRVSQNTEDHFNFEVSAESKQNSRIAFSEIDIFDSQYLGCDLPSRFRKFMTPESLMDCEYFPSWIETHPSSSLFLTGNDSGSLNLWEYGCSSSLFTFYPKEKGATRVIHFSLDGNQFGSVNESGYLNLWALEPNMKAAHPYQWISLYRLNDFAFMNSSSSVLTVSNSYSLEQLNVWDLSMPSKYSNVYAMSLPVGLSTGVGYCPKRQIGLVVNNIGHIYPWDVRQKRIGTAIQAHQNPIDQIIIHPNHDYFATHTTDGTTALWDLRTHNPVCVLNHPSENRAQGTGANSHTVTPVVQFVDDVVFWMAPDGRFCEQKLL